jgi:hypothetical protein
VNAGGGAYWSWFAGHQDCVDADGSVGGCHADEECVRTGDVTRCTFSATGGAVGGSPGKSTCDDGAECGEPVTTTTYGGECGPEAQCPTSSNACAAMPGTAPEPCNDVVLVNPVECPDDTAADPDPRQGCTDPAGDSGAGCTTDDCIAPDEPAADLPAEDEARRVALAVVEASGADVDDAIVTTEAANAWFVTVEPRLDGVPSGLVSFVEVGADLRVLSASGPLGQPEELGEYPLLDTRGAIERANQQAGFVGDTPAIASDTPLGVEGTTGGTETGGTDDTTVATAIAADPCAVPEGASDGCGGTTGCGGDGCVEPTTTIPCKVQADGSEICEVSGCENGTMSCPPAEPCPADGLAATTVPCVIPDCPQAAANDDVAVGAPEVVDCTPPPPIPPPEPQPVEMVLVDAERSLVLLPANDGTGDAYLVPAYRFTSADGGTVDLPAIADEALAGPATTETTVADTVEPAPVPVPEPQPCEVLEEQDPESATTHTVQTCPTPNEDPRVLAEGEEPAIGVGYYVDAEVTDAHCTWLVVELGDQVWWTPGYYKDDLYGWSQPTEGGTFTIHDDGTADFVGDAEKTKTATLVPYDGEGDRPICN